MIDWQNIIALGLVGLAAGYLMRKAWRRIAGHSEAACGTCNHCVTTSTGDSQIPTPTHLVQIESQFGQAGQQADHPHDGAHGPIDHAAR